MGIRETDPLTQLSLPPGFRFYPTDEELMVQYLCRKVAGYHFSLPIIAEIDLYTFDPWELPGKALFGEKEWYFFTPRDRKYPNGSRPNRVAGSGYWKATGTDKVITSEGRKVGIKKALVFYIGKAPKGTKTNWIMHEYRLFKSPNTSGGSKLDDWVLCRIYKKSANGVKPIVGETSGPSSSTSSPNFGGDVMESSSSFPEIGDFGYPGMEDEKISSGLESWSGGFDFNLWANNMMDGPEVFDIGMGQAQLGGHSPLPALPSLCHVDSPEEEKYGRPMESFSGEMYGQIYSGSVDPFGIRYGL